MASDPFQAPTPGTSLPATAPEKPDWKVDYYVPNFGVDHDIIDSKTHLAQAEKATGHEMRASFKKPPSLPETTSSPTSESITTSS